MSSSEILRQPKTAARYLGRVINVYRVWPKTCQVWAHQFPRTGRALITALRLLTQCEDYFKMRFVSYSLLGDPDQRLHRCQLTE